MKTVVKNWVKSLGIAAAVTVAASPAQASVYSYTVTGGQGLTFHNVGTASPQPNTDGTLIIDTDNNFGQFNIGDAGIVTFTGDFSSFTGGSAPHGMFDINVALSQLNYFGTIYKVDGGHQPMLELFGNSMNFWAVWTAPNCALCAPLGDILKDITGSSSTDVPEPGMVGLLGLGAAAVAFRRRRRTNAGKLAAA